MSEIRKVLEDKYQTLVRNGPPPDSMDQKEDWEYSIIEDISDQHWNEIQEIVEGDSPMSMVSDLAEGLCTWEEAADRIAAYAIAAWQVCTEAQAKATASACDSHAKTSPVIPV